MTSSRESNRKSSMESKRKKYERLREQGLTTRGDPISECIEAKHPGEAQRYAISIITDEMLDATALRDLESGQFSRRSKELRNEGDNL